MNDLTTHPIPEPMLTAIGQIDSAVSAILAAKELNDKQQHLFSVGSPFWHAHESIDDKLHDALAALGQ